MRRGGGEITAETRCAGYDGLEGGILQVKKVVKIRFMKGWGKPGEKGGSTVRR